MINLHGPTRSAIIDRFFPKGEISWEPENIQVNVDREGNVKLSYGDQIRFLSPEAVQDLQTGRQRLGDYFEI